ncbi:Ir68a [Drosophila busckii]|uniref:Ir68a n=1 Tax=Drosophila busckii TaxID=30019 RepID=A0A0M4EII4_DROBS|nr:Ir68a [Drosophila busckii]
MAMQLIVSQTQLVDGYRSSLQQLLGHLLWTSQLQRCFAVISDDVHADIYERSFYESTQRWSVPYFMLRINASEDWSNPSQQAQLLLQAIKSSGCDMHVLTLLNGWQVKQFIKYVYDNRALNMQQRFILLHDERLFSVDMLHVWSVFVNAIFLQRQQLNSIKLIVLVAGMSLMIALVEHAPMVLLNKTTNKYEGVEIEIVAALAQTLNFQAVYYTLNESAAANWEQLPQSNDSSLPAGLIGELAQHHARFAIGDLHLFSSYGPHVELSLPHSVECLTFLTPESSADNSWQTFILPFSAGMWFGVLLSLFVVGSIFYVISFLNSLLTRHSQLRFFRCLRRRATAQLPQQRWQRLSFRLALSRRHKARAALLQHDLFDDYATCLLLTYSMLMYVSLPRMPRNWPLRVLTGWYWIYCILLVATYRASFTAILANPAARVTIDSLQELLRTRIPPVTGTVDNKQFFLDASDELAQKVGAQMEVVQQFNDLPERIAQGRCAYYDNEFYLRYLRAADVTQGYGSSALHIMRDCVVQMPVVLGLEKNSPLKRQVDGLLQQLRESGLIEKWLRDAIEMLPAEEQAPQEALMNLKKFWSSFVALGIGYLVSICALLLEHGHFRYIVMKHPMYDAYYPSLYYNFKRLYPDERIAK